MTSSASTAGWLPLAVARAAVAHAPPAQLVPTGGRHAAPEAPGLVEMAAVEQVGAGRHADTQWSREVFDPQRDEDPFEWLGFTT
jgi:hypothetical protein